MAELVSILIPAYNAQTWIAATIQSALEQTWPATEIIVVDDGSRDDTLAVARRFESKSVKIVMQPNSGAASARNTAFQLAQGSYIQWLDADDLLAPDKIAAQMLLAAQCADRRVLLSSPWANFMYRPRAAKFTPTALWQDLPPIDWIVYKWTETLHMQTATWLVSRKLSDAVGPWNTALLGDDDGEYFTRVVLASNRIRFAPEAKVFYRITETSRLSHIGRCSRKLEAHLESMRLQIGYVRAVEDTPRVRAAVVSYLQAWLPYFYPERPDLVEEMRALARAAGGELKGAHIGRRYALIDKVFGRRIAKLAQLHYNNRKQSVLRSWDRLMLELAGQRDSR
jgi:glycosyltransferase involved in cell wall biosynthesis